MTTDAADQRVLIKVLVIDDDRDRDPVYETFFELLNANPDFKYRIELAVPKNPSEAIEYLGSNRMSMVLLDIMLGGENWDQDSSAVRQAVVSTKLPLGLLSGGFGTPEADQITLDLLRSAVSSPKLGIFPFSEAIGDHFYFDNVRNKETVTPARVVSYWKLICLLAIADGADLAWEPKKNGEITFLHLTDTHFGPETKSDYFDAKGIYEGAKRASIETDGLIWTGDITDRGAPDQFEEAAIFLSELKAARVLPFAAPISMAPGNHDLSWPLALSSRLKLTTVAAKTKSATGGSGKTKKKWKWEVQDDSQTPELWKYGFQPFLNFYQSAIHEPAPSVETGFKWRPQWRHLGIAILELPVEAHVVQSRSDQTDTKPFIDATDFSKVSINALQAIEASKLDRRVCIFVVIHGRAPDNAASNTKRWEGLIALIVKMGNPVIVPAGHEHQQNVAPAGRKLTVVGTPHHEAQNEGGLTLPGVGFIQLTGLNTDDLRCGYQKLEKKTDHEGQVVWEPQKAVWHKLNPDSPHHWILFEPKI